MNFRELFSSRPATLILVAINIIVYALVYFLNGSSNWTLTLLENGALFNPLALGKDWWRLLTHMFLHGSIVHLGFNMYALVYAGGDIERLIGTKKFLVIYFLAGFGSALCSLSFSLFQVSVGASGAIFGLFGFSIIINLILSRRHGHPVMPIITNLVVFLVINLAVGEAFHADHAGHIGGLITGALLGAAATFSNRSKFFANIDYVVVVALIAWYLLLPRFQVHYFNFFHQVLHAEDDYNRIATMKVKSDDELAAFIDSNNHLWDSAEVMISGIKSFPGKVKSDSSKLHRYVKMRRAENDYQIRMLRDEIYILMDSVDAIRDSIPSVLGQLDYPIAFRSSRIEKEEVEESPSSPPKMIKVWYDSNWVETPYIGTYFRIGHRDSLGRWQGFVRDYYANGRIQMKGKYKDDKRDGVFIYYSDHDTYESAGRYKDNRNVGKWQTFHVNGKLASETIYQDRSFLKTLYDSAGRAIVVDGNGTFREFYSNGQLKTEGVYENGWKSGVWTGYHPNGNIHYKEEFLNGVLIRGKSEEPSGQRFVYDASSLFPKPEGGFERFHQYVKQQARFASTSVKGRVRLSFRVTASGKIADVEVEEGLTPELNRLAEDIIRNGPAWLPANLHGYQATDGYAFESVEFE